MIRIHKLRGSSLDTFHETYAIQLNDTHPSIAVAELMRLLIDIHEIDWDEAWSITQKALAYTNHTLLARGPGEVAVCRSLPACCRATSKSSTKSTGASSTKSAPSSPTTMPALRVCRSSTRAIPSYVRMAYLATVGSHAVNGVAALHSELLKKTILHDFYELFPEKFFNVTNGVTPRRWLALSNPELSQV